MSSDLHGHPVGRLIVGLFERLDRKRFEVFAYSTSGWRPRTRCASASMRAVDTFRRYPVIDFFEIADAMRADGVDVAFDLTGFTAGAVMSVLQLRPAPVQVNFLGFTGTLASPAIDWIVTDRFCVPPEARPYLVERPLYIEPCYLPNDAARTFSDDAMTRATYKLPDDATVFASMTAAYKIMPEHFELMLDVMKGVPGLGAVDARPARHRRAPLRARRRGARRRSEAADLRTERAGAPLPQALPARRPVPRHDPVRRSHDGQRRALRRRAGARVRRALVRGARFGEPGDGRGPPRARRDVARRRTCGARSSSATTGRASRRWPRCSARTRDTLPLFDLDRYTRAFEEAIERAWRETPEG